MRVAVISDPGLHAGRSSADRGGARARSTYRGARASHWRARAPAVFGHRSARRGARIRGRRRHRARRVQRHRAARDRIAVGTISAYCTSPLTPCARRDAPEQSALFLSEYAADGSPLAADRLTADDIARSGLRADVVVLSGCATGDGRELRGEGVLGLTYGFLANGSHTVIASLWPVEDALTARFMEEFYAAYRVSGRAADALRMAQLRTRGTRGVRGLVEFRGAGQRTALNAALAPRFTNYHARIRDAAAPRRRIELGHAQSARAICIKCHDFAISPTCTRHRVQIFFAPDLVQTLPTISGANCGTMHVPVNISPRRVGFAANVRARSRRYLFGNIFAIRAFCRSLCVGCDRGVGACSNGVRTGSGRRIFRLK